MDIGDDDRANRIDGWWAGLLETLPESGPGCIAWLIVAALLVVITVLSMLPRANPWRGRR